MCSAAHSCRIVVRYSEGSPLRFAREYRSLWQERSGRFVLSSPSFSKRQSHGRWQHCVLFRSFLPAVARSLAAQRRRYKAQAPRAPVVFPRVDDSLSGLCPAIRWPHHSIAWHRQSGFVANTSRRASTARLLSRYRCVWPARCPAHRHRWHEAYPAATDRCCRWHSRLGQDTPCYYPKKPCVSAWQSFAFAFLRPSLRSWPHGR